MQYACLCGQTHRAENVNISGHNDKCQKAPLCQRTLGLITSASSLLVNHFLVDQWRGGQNPSDDQKQKITKVSVFQVGFVEVSQLTLDWALFYAAVPKGSGCQAAQFFTLRKHFFYLASLRGVLKDWNSARLTKALMAMNCSLDLCPVIFTIGITEATKARFTKACAQCLSWQDFFLSHEQMRTLAFRSNL